MGGRPARRPSALISPPAFGARRQTMAIRTTRSAGMLLLAIWLILTGIGGFAALPIPVILMAALAVIAGVLILVGM